MECWKEAKTRLMRRLGLGLYLGLWMEPKWGSPLARIAATFYGALMAGGIAGCRLQVAGCLCRFSCALIEAAGCSSGNGTCLLNGIFCGIIKM